MDQSKANDHYKEKKIVLNDELYKSMEHKKLVYESIEKLAREHGLNVGEKPKNILLQKDSLKIDLSASAKR